MHTTRRNFLKAGGLLAAGAATGLSVIPGELFAATPAETALPAGEGAFMLPPLGYAYAALEPHIDARTMEIHHTKHHQAYITKLNAAVEKEPSLKGKHWSNFLAILN